MMLLDLELERPTLAPPLPIARPTRPAVMAGLPASAPDTPEGRERLQRGVESSARAMGLITAAFSIGTLVFSVAEDGVAATAQRVAPSAHVATTAFLLTMSLLCRRGQPSAKRLRFIDTATTIGGGIGFSLFSAGSPATAARELVLLLFMVHALMIRAAMVPSSGSRTLVLGAIALLPSLLQASLLPEAIGHGALSTAWVVSFTALWGGATLFASTLVSTKIYGLERKVARARRLGPYTLGEKIGEGGMGEVYKASHALLRRPTAVKVVRKGSVNAGTLARFEREVQMTSQLTHPSTVQVYDYGSAPDGTFYYAMEYIDGVTLWQLVQLDGPQHAGRVIHLLAQVCESLAEAHALGLIHRDVKPDNLLVCNRGLVPDVVKVVDFGLARSVRAHASFDSCSPIFGTAQYMAPEAVRRPDNVDARADIYAVGAVAYFLLTGTDVFSGATDAVLAQQLHSIPQSPSSRLGKLLPADLEQIVMRCLAKNPNQRPQTALDLRDELLRMQTAQTWDGHDSQTWWTENEPDLSDRLRARRVLLDAATRSETAPHHLTPGSPTATTSRRGV
jgi:serine/threonine protein kinase